jgi:hypothetical protein
VEGNCRLCEAGRQHGSALGKARGDAAIHRHVHDKRGSVYAFSSELDAWLQSRRLRLEEEEKERRAEAPPRSAILTFLTRRAFVLLRFLLRP